MAEDRYGALRENAEKAEDDNEEETRPPEKHGSDEDSDYDSEEEEEEEKDINIICSTSSSKSGVSPVVSPMVDRISSLPDHLLCHILSFLPTRESIATSFLSSRWNKLWTHVDNLELVDTSWDEASRTRFINFVNRVLALPQAPALKTFLLHCSEPMDSVHVEPWLRVPLERGVKEFYFSSNCWKPVQLPPTVFTSGSLVVMKLNHNIVLNFPSLVHLPSLKILQLWSVICKEHDDYIEKIISGCSILEDLHVQISLRRVTTLSISTPTLKNLRVHITADGNSRSKVEINTPSLKNLIIIQDGFSADYLINNLSNLVQADVTIFVKENNGDCVMKLLRALYNVKFLFLSYWYCTSGINIVFDDPPMFHNLVNLKLKVRFLEWHVLKALLEKSHNLKVLDIEKTQPLITHNELVESFWSQPSHTPMCLLSHLETIYFRGFEGREQELKFVKYILKKARVLKKMTVICTRFPKLEEKVCVMKKLLMFRRRSVKCRLAFD